MSGAGGIRLHLGQFLLLVLVNGLVGVMVGQERSILAPMAAQEFGLASRAAVFSFLATFGTTKAVCNLVAGSLADRFGRKQVLVLGWLFAVPVPLILMAADRWLWVVLANVLLGINQGLCWSATVIMKLDLAGPRQAGLATAANEWAGYLGAAAAAWATGYLAALYGLRPVPFYPGLLLALAGLVLSLVFVRPTGVRRTKGKPGLSLTRIVRQTWQDRNLLAASQAGLITNLKDGLVWALIPLYLQQAGLAYGRIGLITALYPVVWGFGQLAAGPLSDRVGRTWLIVPGLGVQGLGLLLFAAGSSYGPWLLAAVITGLGTALVYPTLLAAVSDLAAPDRRGSLLGGYRLWRDAGYAVAGLGLGPLADAFGAAATILAVAGLAAGSALLFLLLRSPSRA